MVPPESAELFQESVEGLRRILEESDIGVSRLLPDRRILDVNPRLCEMLGYSKEELVGLSATVLSHPDDRDGGGAHVARLLSGETNVFSQERRYLRKDGTTLWVHSTVALVRDAAGEPRELVTLVHDISQRREAEEALWAADRRKDEFLAMLAHELRNPLSPLRNAVHVLTHRNADPEARRLLEIADRQVSHMSRLIDDLLDVSRISSGKILLRQQRLDLVELVRQTAEDHRPELEAAGLSLEVRLPADAVWVEGDPTRLAQSVGNLLNNAAKFTDAGGRVRVELRAGDGEVMVEVRDTGIGMEPDLVGRLFEAFSQADRSLDRSRGGLGLGLALVKGLIELHHGSVEASSEGLGRGSRFVFRLPLQPGPETASGPRDEGAGVAGMRILIIEDNPDAAESLQILLELSGYEVETAPDGFSGLEAAHRFQPRVVICDIGLPGGMDGYAVARELRAANGSIPYLIALTGYGQPEDKQRAKEAGFDLHITKPMDPAELKRVLAEQAAAAGA